MSLEGTLTQLSVTLNEISKTSYDFGRSKGHFVTEGQFRILVNACAAFGGRVEFVPSSSVLKVDEEAVRKQIEDLEAELLALATEALLLRGEQAAKVNLQQGAIKSRISKLRRSLA